jgi:hypothetical protein
VRDYGKIFTRFWTTPDVAVLSDPGKLLALYLLSGTHTNMIGCFRLPHEYVSADLGWDRRAVTTRFAELSKRGFLIYDAGTQWVFINNFLRWNPIENPKQGVAAARLFAEVPKNSKVSEPLRNAIQEHADKLPHGFAKGLETV